MNSGLLLMSDLVKIEFSAIKVGKPLPWPVFDGTGQMLLKKGYCIDSESQIESLIERGVYRTGSSTIDEVKSVKYQVVSPFCELGSMAEMLKKAFKDLFDEKSSAIGKLNIVCERINEICKHDPDACIASIHLYSKDPSAEEYALYYAILCAIMAPKLGFSDTQNKQLIIAALTANVALQPYLDKLNTFKCQLTDKQRTLVRQHPEQSIKILAKAGINDEELFNIIIQHHEKVDGTGYPKEVSETDLLQQSKLLSVCEHYVALVSKRAYRETSKTNEALREVYRRASKDTTETLYLTFIKTLSVYPPGTFVRLSNNEVAVITKRPSNESGYQMKAILSPRGGPYAGCFSRDSSLADHKIEETVQPDSIPSLNLAELWGYLQ